MEISIFEDQMALRNEDKTWIADAISEAIRKAFNPRGWQRVPYSIRQWGHPAIVVAVILGLFGTVVALGIRIADDAGKNSEFRGRTDQKLADTDQRLAGIEKSILLLRGTLAASNPTNSQNQAQAKEVLAAARQKSIVLPSAAVEQIGKNFIEASKTDAKAWDVAIDFVNYSSSKNVAPAGANAQGTPLGADAIKSLSRNSSVPGKGAPGIISLMGAVAPGEAARFEPIGMKPPTSASTHTLFYRFDGGATWIDDMYFKKCVFVGVEIHYEGGPLILEDVVFVNCTFVIENGDPGRTLGERLLAESSVSFRIRA